MTPDRLAAGVRQSLRLFGPAGADDALKDTLAACLAAGVAALDANRGRPPAERFAQALQAMQEVLDELALGLAEGAGTED
jgi:hypothetical protein